MIILITMVQRYKKKFNSYNLLRIITYIKTDPLPQLESDSITAFTYKPEFRLRKAEKSCIVDII